MRYRRKHIRSEEQVDYWQSIADALTALLLAVLLLVSILVLVICSNNGWLDGSFNSDGADAAQQGDAGEGNQDEPESNDGEGSNGGSAGHGGNGGDWDEDASAGPGGGSGSYDDPDPGKGEYDDRIRAAVRVTVVDGETLEPVKVKGISFELLQSGNALTLSNYYPKRVDYTQFETASDGSFFLPEKVEAGSYQLASVAVPEGYDLSESVDFFVDRDCDWSQPLEVTVKLWPCRNTVRIQQVDSITGEGVAGGTWRVIAAKDVSTADGTLRHSKGDVVAKVRIDEDGYGISDELYLGEYELEQKKAPEYYAAYEPEWDPDNEDDALTVQVEKKAPASAGDDESSRADQSESDASSPLHSFALSKTRYTVRLIDEETKEPLEGATFRLVPGDVTVQTNAEGVAVFENLEKGTNYSIAQESTLTGYRQAADVSFAVDKKGLIDGSPSMDEFVTNYMVRVSVTACGKVLRKPLAGCSLELRDSSGAMIDQWESGLTARSLEGIEPGVYELVGPEGSVAVKVVDAAGTQKLAYSVWTVYDFAALGAGVMVLLAAVAALALRVRSNRRNGGE